MKLRPRTGRYSPALATLALGAFWLAGSGQAGADGAPFFDRDRFSRFDYGIICAEDSGQTAPAPGTIAGSIDIYAGEPYVARRTVRIPAIPGLAFGVVAQASGAADLSGVAMEMTHPPMAPSGTTRQTWESFYAASRPSASFFRFDHPEERVPGIWQMKAVIDGTVAYSVTFEVVDPALMPGAVNPCPGEAVTS